MKISSLEIQNFRLFNPTEPFILSDIGLPDTTEGSGLTVFVGENSCGKSTILDAFALPLLTYKGDTIQLNDFNDPKHKVQIKVFTESDFEFDGTMPRAVFKGKGFEFEAGVRSRRTKAYLSTIVVHDQRFLKADGETKPANGTPDLRISVNNPFKGPRFSENDIIFLDRNRTFQIRSGTYNDTRFDKLMEDFDFQYQKKVEEIPNLNEHLDHEVKTHIEHRFLEQAVNKFREISGIDLTLNLIENWHPFKDASFSVRMQNNLQIGLNSLGSGYEMIFSILYSFYLSQQSGKELIAFIDEPELHMHPKLQNDFVNFILEISKTSQIIVTTHSPLFVNQIMQNDKVKVKVIKRGADNPEVVPVESKVLPFKSANEINYLAFNLPSEGYLNELYGFTQDKLERYTINSFEDHLFSEGIPKNKVWIKESKGTSMFPVFMTLPSYVRNSIHHPENKQNERFTYEELKEAIDILRNLLAEL